MTSHHVTSHHHVTSRVARCKHSHLTHAASTRYFIYILLLSGDIAPNPGPRPRTVNWRHPCGSCKKPVRSNQRGLQCDGCDTWTHLKCLPECMAISVQEYDLLGNSSSDWYCFNCLLPTLSDSFFDNSQLSSHTDESPSENENGSDESH